MKSRRHLAPVRRRKRRSSARLEKRRCRRLKIEIGRDKPDEIRRIEIIRGKRPERTLAGATVTDLDIFTQREVSLPPDIRGVIVVSVDENSPAFTAGLRRWDVIMEVNGSPVTNTDHALLAGEVWKDGRIVLEVWTDKGVRYLTVHKS